MSDVNKVVAAEAHGTLLDDSLHFYEAIETILNNPELRSALQSQYDDEKIQEILDKLTLDIIDFQNKVGVYEPELRPNVKELVNGITSEFGFVILSEMPNKKAIELFSSLGLENIDGFYKVNDEYLFDRRVPETFNIYKDMMINERRSNEEWVHRNKAEPHYPIAYLTHMPEHALPAAKVLGKALLCPKSGYIGGRYVPNNEVYKINLEKLDHREIRNVLDFLHE